MDRTLFQTHPYRRRADELGSAHGVPGIGSLRQYLTPPGWEAGQDPIEPDAAHALYQRARDEAGDRLDREAAQDVSFGGEELAQRIRARDAEFQAGRVRDEVVLRERVGVWRRWCQGLVDGEERAGQVDGIGDQGGAGGGDGGGGIGGGTADTNGRPGQAAQLVAAVSSQLSKSMLQTNGIGAESRGASSHGTQAGPTDAGQQLVGGNMLDVGSPSNAANTPRSVAFSLPVNGSSPPANLSNGGSPILRTAPRVLALRSARCRNAGIGSDGAESDEETVDETFGSSPPVQTPSPALFTAPPQVPLTTQSSPLRSTNKRRRQDTVAAPTAQSSPTQETKSPSRKRARRTKKSEEDGGDWLADAVKKAQAALGTPPPLMASSESDAGCAELWSDTDEQTGRGASITMSAAGAEAACRSGATVTTRAPGEILVGVCGYHC